jgi:RNA polymerase sigma-70 factor (ECF subfamily)
VRVAAVIGTGPGAVDVAAAVESPLAAAERAELRARLAGALATLPNAHREVLLLHDLEGWRHKEIGALLGVPEGTSRSYLFAARRRVRAQLQPAFGPAVGGVVARAAG